MRPRRWPASDRRVTLLGPKGSWNLPDPPVQFRLCRRYNSSAASRSKYRTTALHCSHLSSRMCRSIWSKGTRPHLRLQGLGSGQVLINKLYSRAEWEVCHKITEVMAGILSHGLLSK